MKNRKLLFSFTCLLVAVSKFEIVSSANILVFAAVASHSTRLSLFPTIEALAEKGHHVTYLSPYDNFEDPEKKSKVKYYTPEKWKNSIPSWEIDIFDLRKNGNIPQSWMDYHHVGILACENLYTDPEFVNWVKTSKFDLVLMESAMNDCALGLVHVFKAKFAVYGTGSPFPWFTDSYGFPDESSSIMNAAFNFPSAEKMSILQRIQNGLVCLWFSYNRENWYFPILEDMTRKGLQLSKDELPNFREIEQNVSLVLLTTHLTIDQPRSLPPHVIPIGGAVVTKKKKPMTKEMETFINSAKDGFIFVSFGTGVDFNLIGGDVQDQFIAGLAALPKMKFLWKNSVPIKKSLPSNVLVVKWAPQQTILEHPKIKAFITHCGMGSTTELIHFGVPAVLIPMMAEQDVHAQVLEARGVGVRIEVVTLKKQEVIDAVTEILTNDKYRTAAKKLSAAFHDRVVDPISLGVWWLEYILRHDNSNDYLLPVSIRQSWWKRRQIDIWFLLWTGLAVAILIVFSIVRVFAKLLFGGSSKQNKVSTKKKTM